MNKDYQLVHQMDMVMRRIHLAMQTKVPPADDHKIGPLGTMALDKLAEIEPAPIQRLVKAMERDKSQMTRAIQKLEAKEMIQRQRSPEDGRIDLLQLTPKGHRYVAVVRNMISEVVADVFSPLTAREMAQLSRLLHKIV